MCDSRSARRRNILATAALGAASCCVMAIAAPVCAQQKTAKADAAYRDHPNGPAHCEVCAYFQAPVACRLVRGEVSPNGWCSLFQARTA